MQSDEELLQLLYRLAPGQVNPDLSGLRQWLGQNIWRLALSERPFDRHAVMELDLALGAIDDGQEEPGVLSRAAQALVAELSPAETDEITFRVGGATNVLVRTANIMTGASLATPRRKPLEVQLAVR